MYKEGNLMLQLHENHIIIDKLNIKLFIPILMLDKRTYIYYRFVGGEVKCMCIYLFMFEKGAFNILHAILEYYID